MRLRWVVGGAAPTRGDDSVAHPVRTWPPRNPSSSRASAPLISAGPPSSSPVLFLALSPGCDDGLASSHCVFSCLLYTSHFVIKRQTCRVGSRL